MVLSTQDFKPWETVAIILVFLNLTYTVFSDCVAADADEVKQMSRNPFCASLSLYKSIGAWATS